MTTAAVIGLGYFSQFHLASWDEHPEVTLAGISDMNPALVAQHSQRLGVPGFGSAKEILERVDPDIVDLVVPPPAHAALVRMFLKPGRTIVCQKPFCTSLAEAEEITAEAEAAGADLIIHENFRFEPWYREIRKFLDEGRLGRVWSCQFNLRPGDGRGPDAYLARQPAFQKMTRFLIQETAVHLVDTFRWLFGPITSVYADVRQLNPDIAGEDAGVMLMDHASGVKSVFDGNRLGDHAAENKRYTMGEMIVEGEKGALTLDGYGKIRFRAFDTNDWQDVPVTFPIDDTQFGGGCPRALIHHVVDARAGRGVFENTARDYLEVVRVTEAAYLSAAEGRRVVLG